MPNKLHIVALVALLDAVDTDRIPVCRVASVTPVTESTSTFKED